MLCRVLAWLGFSCHVFSSLVLFACFPSFSLHFSSEGKAKVHRHVMLCPLSYLVLCHLLFLFVDLSLPGVATLEPTDPSTLCPSHSFALSSRFVSSERNRKRCFGQYGRPHHPQEKTRQGILLGNVKTGQIWVYPRFGLVFVLVVGFDVALELLALMIESALPPPPPPPPSPSCHFFPV